MNVQGKEPYNKRQNKVSLKQAMKIEKAVINYSEKFVNKNG